jgi:hypothetical protein
MDAAQADTAARTPPALLILAVVLLANLLILVACPAPRDATEARSQQPVPDTPGAADASAAVEAGGGEADQAQDGAARDQTDGTAAGIAGGADAADDAVDADGVSAGEQSLPPAEALVTEWELDGFRLGMSVRETRARMGPLLQGHLHEHWVVEGETGMILAGTYAEPVNMQGSLLFLDGQLVAVLASKLEEVHIFNQNYATLRGQLGETVGYVPEFAQGRRFIDEMLAADPQPSPQYMWAQEETHRLYIIGYFEPDMLASYILLDADKYDDVAAALESAGGG